MDELDGDTVSGANLGPRGGPTVRLSLHSASVLATASGALGALDTAVAGFLLGDPLNVVGDRYAELTALRLAGIRAIKAAKVASDSEEEVDLDLVAEALLEAVRGALTLALRCLEMARRTDLGPGVETRAEGLAGTVETIAELLPGAERC